jgi:hypothetical protein
MEDAALISSHVIRVEVHPDQLNIELAGTKAANPKRAQHHRKVVTVPWRKVRISLIVSGDFTRW